MWWIRTIYGRLPVCGVLWFFSYLIFHCLILACASSLYCFQPDNRSLVCTGAHCLFVFPSFLRLVSFRPKENQIKSKQYNWRCWRRFQMCMRTHTPIYSPKISERERSWTIHALICPYALRYSFVSYGFLEKLIVILWQFWICSMEKWMAKWQPLERWIARPFK